VSKIRRWLMPDDELRTPAGHGEEIAPAPSPAIEQPTEEMQDLNNDAEPASATPLQAIEEGLQAIAGVDSAAAMPVDVPDKPTNHRHEHDHQGGKNKCH
jgi:hypothetical protein